mgnify:CR=1 FL=1
MEKNLDKIKVDGGVVYDIYSKINHEETSNLSKKLEEESNRIQKLIDDMNSDINSSINEIDKRVRNISDWYEGN